MFKNERSIKFFCGIENAKRGGHAGQRKLWETKMLKCLKEGKARN